MSANVETMFYVRETPWHGLGTKVMEAPTSTEALTLAGLDWKVTQKLIETEDGIPISGFKANIRDSDEKVLGVVTDRYKVVQNTDAFSFTDELLGEGVTYETAGSLQEGRRTWLLAKLPQRYIISSDEITPYLVFMNSHDGTGSIKAAMTPIRVVCQNTLNLALSTAKRYWSTNHTGDIQGKINDAKYTLL
ncbi:phage/plasmid-related protein TIGR03299 [Hungatella hathewayi CAG:224]|nr:phage/plasmid-related protein TIGR03299 [Hungatella hathewayi CAG:224]